MSYIGLFKINKIKGGFITTLLSGVGLIIGFFK